jgi:predicted nuclease of restriction endonuclease-like (RecB) superfamily
LQQFPQEEVNMDIVEKNNFDLLLGNIYQAHNDLQNDTVRVVNRFLTIRNWLIGHYIVEYEQNGEDRAKYGEKLLEEIALKLKEKGVLGMGERYLRMYRTFYLKYPQIQRVLPDYPIRKTLFSKLQTTDLSQTIQTDELIENNILNPNLLLLKLNFTHFIELIRVADPTERLFYEVEAIKNNWSIRELKRAINTSLALRTTLSINKESLIAKIKNLKPENSAEIIRNPYIIEFLGLEEKNEYSETDLEQSILDNLQKFLMELGSGFCFEARQKRITFNNRHYRIDLVFYHKILKCNVLLDLKQANLTMQMQDK